MANPLEEMKHKWGMVIDQDLCTGCQACVTACATENNVPFVGETDAAYGRSLHWIRVERFWEGEYPEVKSTPFQPVLCQQCGHAPCEPVCPVYASVHSEVQQINVQVYNRCVGTRYCANNCPYQARVFNWRDYHEEGPLNNALNPNVTVRRRGIMEKCTFCVQRIVRGEDTAKAEGREVADGEVVPACAQACPTQAIVFGDLNDHGSRVRAQAEGRRSYTLLAELNIRPRTSYQARLRNPAPGAGAGGGEASHT